MALKIFESKRIFITLGDDGAMLALVDKGVLISRAFALSPSVFDRREIDAIILNNPTIPITILLDSTEQAYVKQVFPGISSMSIGGFVKRRLERDFAKTDFKGAVSISRDKKGRKDWNYMLFSAPLTPLIAEWLDYFENFPNVIKSINLFPVETSLFVDCLNKTLFKEKYKNSSPEWQFIVTHNKTSGFRQTIINNGVVLFTHLIRHGKESLVDIIAGNIEQEIVNTIDYLRRLGLTDDKEIDIIAIVSNELKASLLQTKVHGKSLVLLSPQEVNVLLGFDYSLEKNDKFADIVVIKAISTKKPVLSFKNKKKKKVDLLPIIQKVMHVLAITSVLIAVIYSCYLGYKIISVINKISSAEDKKVVINNEWKKTNKLGSFPLEDSYKIRDAVSLRNKILNDQKNPIDILEKISSLNFHSQVIMQSFNWKYEKSYNAAVLSSKIDSSININLSIKKNNITELFDEYASLSKQVNKEFSDFIVDISKLPEKFSYSANEEIIPIKITFSWDSSKPKPVPTPSSPTVPRKGGM